MFGCKTTDWKTAKKLIGNINFLDQMKGYKIDNYSDKLFNQVEEIIKDLDINQVMNVSKAAASVFSWVKEI
jgi:hypothetical protein